ncbi:hypothetical protein Q9966_011973 [Columba livia]|nr:hypothetical protein Q9966_011973 [Columba livia]
MDYEATRNHQDFLSYFLWAKLAPKPDEITHGSSVKLSEFKPPQGKFAIFFAYLHKSVFLQVAAVYILTIPYPPDPKGNAEYGKLLITQEKMASSASIQKRHSSLGGKDIVYYLTEDLSSRPQQL